MVFDGDFCFTSFLSIGSNKGDKARNLDQAIERLDNHPLIRVDHVSLFYRTRPQNFEDQDWFVNAALKIATRAKGPFALLEILKQIEGALDKKGKEFRFGPRIMDLDILYFENWVLKTRVLEIPHPRMHERCFVLKPVCDIGAHTVHPVLNLTTHELLKQIENQDGQEVIELDRTGGGR